MPIGSDTVTLIKRNTERILRRFDRLTAGDVGIAAITLAELRYGVAKSQKIKANTQAKGENWLD